MPRKPATRDLVPPTLGEDAAERKRVLNILAQRRYRRRKKERLQALEARTQTSGPSSDTLSCNGTEPHATSPSERARLQTSNCTGLDAGLGGIALDSNSDDLLPTTSLTADTLEAEDIPTRRHNPTSPAVFDFIPTDLDSELFLEFPDLVTSGYNVPQAESWSNCDQMAWDIEGLESQLAVQHFCRPKATHDISAELQTEDTLSFTFPDDRVLEVPSLTLLNAAMKVAHRLNVSNLIWDFSAISPFYRESSATSPSSISSQPSFTTPSQASESSFASPQTSASSSTNLDTLPPHLRPTSIQRLIPHHPILDLLPWPGTRNKLIQVFSLPAEVRPGSARDPMALLRLVQDLEDDGGEGVRISGQDPFELLSWEIGQIMLERWWWAFEIGVVEASNRARMKRGEKRLTLTCSGIE